MQNQTDRENENVITLKNQENRSPAQNQNLLSPKKKLSLIFCVRMFGELIMLGQSKNGQYFIWWDLKCFGLGQVVCALHLHQTLILIIFKSLIHD